VRRAVLRPLLLGFAHRVSLRALGRSLCATEPIATVRFSLNLRSLVGSILLGWAVLFGFGCLLTGEITG
ncbi:hypothetical protein, partial [Sphaerotilus uruguayifluvii]|uniref:hypothetical protein n=1 Tax=Sphaerotilus uruguayifluvii TaxID=2735897 RepID=UPI001C2DBAFD